MGAAAADRDSKLRFGQKYVYPVKGSKTIYGGTLVCVGADGYAIPAADTAGARVVGVAANYVKNGSSTDGAVSVEVWRDRHLAITTAGATVADVGRPVFVAYDNEVSLVNGNVIAGVVTEYVSATEIFIDMLPAIMGAIQERVISIPVKFASIVDGDLVSAVNPGIEGVVTKITCVCTDKVTTGSKMSTLTPSIGTTAITGGVLALKSADFSAVGKVLAATAITAKNRFTKADTIKIVASSTTAFAEGEGVILITVV